jgi:NitT/TauT family transport system ATP-binding protein
MMCDRILLLSSNPGRIAAEIAVPLPHPRNLLDNEFRNIVDEFYSNRTTRTTESLGALSKVKGELVQPLAPVSINRLGAFIEALAAPPYEGHIMMFAELKDGAIKLTAAGRVFVQGEPRSASSCSGSICSGLCCSLHIFAISSTTRRASSASGEVRT